VIEAFEQAVDRLIARIEDPTPITFDGLRDIAGDVVQAGEFVDGETRSAGVGKLVDLILSAQPMRAAMVALACGALVEQGAHPYLAVHAIITRLSEILGQAEQFVRACLERAKADGVPEPEAIDRYGQGLSKTLSAQATAYSAMEILCRPAVAMISRSERARRAANDEGRMVAKLSAFPIHHDMLHWLSQLLSVLDHEKMLVIHPEYQLGYEVEITGIAGNHQLFVFIEDTLIGDEHEGWLTGEKPRLQVVSAAREFNQYNHATPHEFAFHYSSWRGLGADGVVDLQSHEHWVWGEGIPADIPKFDDVRVLLLSEPPYKRSFGINAIFEGLEPDLTVVRQLSLQEVTDVLDRIKQAL
jgi:hypothetical protein